MTNQELKALLQPYLSHTALTVSDHPQPLTLSYGEHQIGQLTPTGTIANYNADGLATQLNHQERGQLRALLMDIAVTVSNQLERSDYHA